MKHPIEDYGECNIQLAREPYGLEWKYTLTRADPLCRVTADIESILRHNYPGPIILNRITVENGVMTIDADNQKAVYVIDYDDYDPGEGENEGTYGMYWPD